MEISLKIPASSTVATWPVMPPGLIKKGVYPMADDHIYGKIWHGFYGMNLHRHPGRCPLCVFSFHENIMDQYPPSVAR
jgi:hypothetical protein